MDTITEHATDWFDLARHIMAREVPPMPDDVAEELFAHTIRYDDAVTRTITGRAYGGCIEPDGMDLLDESWTVDCPWCSNKEARSWSCERAEGGSLNYYRGTECRACGYFRGEQPDSDDDWDCIDVGDE